MKTITKIDSSGRVVIPVDIRNKLFLFPGDRIELEIKPIKDETKAQIDEEMIRQDERKQLLNRWGNIIKGFYLTNLYGLRKSLEDNLDEDIIESRKAQIHNFEKELKDLEKMMEESK